jgi:hypothetical protein
MSRDEFFKLLLPPNRLASPVGIVDVIFETLERWLRLRMKNCECKLTISHFKTLHNSKNLAKSGDNTSSSI